MNVCALDAAIKTGRQRSQVRETGERTRLESCYGVGVEMLIETGARGNALRSVEAALLQRQQGYEIRKRAGLDGCDGVGFQALFVYFYIWTTHLLDGR